MKSKFVRAELRRRKKKKTLFFKKYSKIIIIKKKQKRNKRIKYIAIYIQINGRFGSSRIGYSVSFYNHYRKYLKRKRKTFVS